MIVVVFVCVFVNTQYVLPTRGCGLIDMAIRSYILRHGPIAMVVNLAQWGENQFGILQCWVVDNQCQCSYSSVGVVISPNRIPAFIERKLIGVYLTEVAANKEFVFGLV